MNSWKGNEEKKMCAKHQNTHENCLLINHVNGVRLGKENICLHAYDRVQ